MLAGDGIHSIEKINGETWRIDESGIANAYLLLGSESALLIDCGVGLGDIRRTVEELTALPVTLALTHRHCDHAGGRNYFREYFVNRRDGCAACAVTSSAAASRILLLGAVAGGIAPKGAALSKKPYRAKMVLFDDSRSFELGGRTVRVKNVPGHTRGSVVFIDDKYRLMFTGDDVNPYLWMQLPGASTLSEWLPGAREILALADTYTAFAGHESGRITKRGVEEIIAVTENLLEEGPGRRRGFIDYPGAGAPVHVLVTRGRIR